MMMQEVGNAVPANFPEEKFTQRRRERKGGRHGVCAFMRSSIENRK